ncbi:hypothetical protein OEZ86_009965 [Tetradesmus obliquus]|nr:hypothetical protein OEZ86_009965 [Tetradesmus obliquus]
MQLSALLQQLQEYTAALSSYQVQRQAYEAQFQQRLQELQQQQDSLQETQQQPAQTSAQQQQQQDSSLFRRLLRSAGFLQESKQAEISPAQKARQAAAARRAQALQELGPGPQPPAAPQGLYVYGSVGSGKSLLMDMFYDTARQHLQLDHSRRLHFNAAMLEYHSRLHHLDVKRQRQQQRKQEAAAEKAAAALQSSSSTGSYAVQHPVLQGVEPGTAAAAAAAGVQQQPEGADHLVQEHEAAEQLEEACCNDAASDVQVSAWFDEGILRQREAKAAVLAIRRHLREARAGRVPEARLAAANAAVMSAAARSFIRADSPDPHAGWAGSSSSNSSSGRMAALLCFDEMQVGDVFSAAALKALLEALTAEGCVLVGDVFSAAALKALLEALTAEGCVVVTTSNRHPADLPRHGLHEAMFGHFLNTLFTSCRLFELSSATDFRRLSITGPAMQLLQQPLLPQLTSRHSSSSSSALAVPRAASGVASFHFLDLCAGPLGAADYMALAHNYHTVFITGIPAMSMNQRDQARRFITLVDELYNARCLLVCSAALPPDQLFAGASGEEPILDLEGLQFEGAVEGSRLRTNLMADGGVAPVRSSAETAALLGGMEEQFAFSRAVSRLFEMQSPLYAAARPRQ